MTRDIAIRPEAPADFEAIRTVHAEAFGQPDEADLVERLRDDGEFVAALSAVRDGHVVGHIVFSRLPIRAVNRKIAVRRWRHLPCCRAGNAKARDRRSFAPACATAPSSASKPW